MKKLFIIFLLFYHINVIADSWVPLDTNVSFAGIKASRAFTIGNLAYVLEGTGGFMPPNNSFFSYNSVLDVWTQKASYPSVTYGETCAFAIGNNGYIGLGSDINGLNNNFYEYNSLTNSWSQRASFPGYATRIAFSGAVSGVAIIGCATDELLNPYDEVWEYNPVADSWTQVANFPYADFNLQAEVYNGYVYVPYPNFNSGDMELWRYDRVLNIWVQLANCPQYMSYYSTFTINDNIYVGMGMNINPFSFNTNFWKYNISSDIWQQITSYPGVPVSVPISFSIGNNGFVGYGEDFGIPSAIFFKYIPDSTTSISYLEDENNSISVHPNIAIDIINVICESGTDFQIVNSKGQYFPLNNKITRSKNIIEVSITHLNSGVYYIITDESFAKFIKL